MKHLDFRTLILLIILGIAGHSINAQVPEMFNYQAVARNQASGEPLQNASLTVRIAILSAVEPDVILWEEEHSVNTNEFGLFTLEIGDPNATIIEAPSGSFAAIDWTGGNYYLRPSIKEDAENWQQMTPSKLIAVPFAILAKDVDNKQQLSKSGDMIYLTEGGSVDLSGYLDPDQTIDIDGTTLSISGSGSSVDLAGFLDPDQTLSLTGNTLSISGSGSSVDLSAYLNPKQTISKSDNTVTLSEDGGSFSLGEYVNQFDANVDTLYKLDGSLVLGSSKAGGSKLAVVSDNDASEDALFEVKRADGQTVFAVYPEAVRMFVAKGDPEVKAPGSRGGFAVAGFDRDDKATPLNDLLWLTPDSVRFYIDDTQTGKAAGSRGGFAVAGFDRDKATPGAQYMSISGSDVADVIPGSSQILFYPRKDAFMAGYIAVEDPVMVGQNSTSIGYLNIASGNFSQALGFQSEATADYAMAVGNQAIASGTGSFALGQGASASNNESYAFGRDAIAEGYRSFAFGSAGVDTLGVATDPTTATGDYSFAIGQGANAINQGGLAMGVNAKSAGNYSVALGYKAYALGYLSTAIGLDAKSSGYGSISLGRGSEASNSSSVAIGTFSIADGLSSSALGTGSNVSGDYSTAIGFLSETTGRFSSSMGYRSVAGGQASVAIGNNTETTGDEAFGFGNNLIAKAGEHVVGRFNDNTVSNAAFMIGIGSIGSGRKNGMWIDNNAYVYFPDSPTITIGKDSEYSQLSRGDIFLRSNSPSLSLDEPSSLKRWIFDVENGYLDLTELTGTVYTERVSIEPGGNVGIGVSDPVYKFNVVGESGFTDDIYLRDGSLTNSVLARIFDSGDEGLLDLYDGNVVKTRIRAASSSYFLGGNVGIGTNVPAFPLEINGSTINGTPFFTLKSTAGDVGMKFLGSTGRAFVMGIDNTDGACFKILQANYMGDADVFTITSANRVGVNTLAYTYNFEVGGSAGKSVGGSTWAVISDERYKTDVATIENALERIKMLRPVSYVWNDLFFNKFPDGETTTQYSFIAQEFENVFPNSVITNDDGYKSIDIHNVNIYSVKAIQELSQIVEEKETRISELENENAEIRARLSALEAAVNSMLENQ